MVEGPHPRERTAQLARRYAERLDAAQSAAAVPRVMWVAPHRLAAENVRRQLVGLGIDAALSPGVTTFARLAEAMVSTSLEAPAVLPRSVTRRLVRQAIRSAAKGGELSLLLGVQDRTGLVDACETMIGEWKSRGVTSEEFSTIARRGDSPRDRELAIVYSQYSESLEKIAAADRHDMPRLAVEILRDEAGFDLPEFMVVDGFSTFARYERELLGEFLSRGCEVQISLPAEAGNQSRPGRGELFDHACRTNVLLRGLTTNLSIDDCSDGSSDNSQPIALEYLVDHLFSTESGAMESVSTPGSVRVVPAADVTDEVERAARAIKLLLVEQNVVPEQIVVAVPSLQQIRERFEDVFTSYGIPIAMPARRAVGEDAGVAAIDSLFRLHASDWPFRELLATVANRELRLLDTAEPTSRWTTARGVCEWMIRDLQLARGRQPLTDAIDRLAATTDGEVTEPNSRAHTARLAHKWFTSLGAAFDELPEKATALEWIAAAEQLAIRVGMQLETGPKSAWQTIREAAAWADRTAAGASWTLGEWMSELSDWLTSLTQETVLEEQGRVRVYAIDVARFAEAEHLFVLGLTEQALLGLASRGGLFKPEDYDRLSSQARGERAGKSPPAYARTMEVFYELVAMPRRSITLSYAALDKAGQLAPASPMLEEVCRTLGKAWTDARLKMPLLSVLPPVDVEPASGKEWRLRGVADALDGNPKMLGEWVAYPPARRSGRSLLAALDVVHHRASGDAHGLFEGILASPAAKSALARSFPPSYLWSASALETYATCPYKFLLGQVLRLEPLQHLALETDYARRGSLFHAALKLLHESIGEVLGEGAIPTTMDAGEFSRAFESSVQTAIEGLAQFGVEGVLNELLATEIKRWGANYREQHEKYDGQSSSWETPLVPRHFELRFGPPSRRHDEDEDPASSDEPLLIDVGGETIRIGGRIDRIDVGQVGATPVMQVIDYKSAREQSLKHGDVADGRQLQPALYAMAAAQVVSVADAGVVPLSAGYWVVRKNGYDEKTSLAMHRIEAGMVVATPEWQELQPKMTERIKQLITGIRSAEFPMQNIDEDCTSRCDFGHICRVQQVRSLGKTWPPVEMTADIAEGTEV